MTRISAFRAGRSPARLAAALLSTLVGLALGATPARAQSPDWSATVLVQPTPSPFLADWERNPTTATLTLSYLGSLPADYRVEVAVRSSTRGALGTVVSPVLSAPAGPATQLFTSVEVADWQTKSSDKATTDLVLRTGVLPEGDYELCARALTVSGTQLARGCGTFRVRLPDPPTLVAPANGAAAASAQPVFQWTPVNVPPGADVTYRVTVAERLAGQTAQVALEANRPVLKEDVTTGAPVLVYPSDALPLVAGHTYAWRVEALDGEGRSLTTGAKRSEIWTFTAAEPTGALAALALPDTIDLVPGYSRLVGVRAAVKGTSDVAVTLDGPVTLEIMTPFMARIPVSAESFLLDRGLLPGTRVLGGRLHGTLAAGAVPKAISGDHVRFDDVEYTAAKGLTVGGTLTMPGMDPIPMEGRARVIASGLVGTLQVKKTFFAGEQDPIKLELRRATVNFPLAAVDLGGALSIFGAEANCRLVFAMDREGEPLKVQPLCPERVVLAITGDTLGATVHVRGLAGTIAVDLEKKTIAPDLTAAGSLNFGVVQGCGANFPLTIKDSAVVGAVDAKCEGDRTQAEFSWFALKLFNFRSKQLAYSKKDGWKFEIETDAYPKILGLDSLLLPEIHDINFAHSGIRVMPMDGPTVTKGTVWIGAAYRLQPTRAHMDPVVVSWAEWAAQTKKFAVTMEGGVQLPSLPTTLTGCFAESPVPMAHATFQADTFTTDLVKKAFEPKCVIGFNTMGRVGFEMDSVGGQLKIPLKGNQWLQRTAISQRDAEIWGALTLPDLFSCSKDGKNRIALAKPLTVNKDGIVTGTFTKIGIPCPVALPGVTLQTAEATLTLENADGKQKATLEGNALARLTLAAGDTNATATGSFAMDLVAGKVTDSKFHFAGPVRLDIPRANPVVSFSLAQLDYWNGEVHLDGRHRFLFGDTTKSLGVTFDRVVLDPARLKVRTGRVLFDAGFGLELVMKEDPEAPEGARWRTVERRAASRFAQGVRLDLPETTVIDSTGVVVNGGGEARVVYGDRDLDALSARFTDNFALGLAPFAVKQGRTLITWRDEPVAQIDSLGFHPDVIAFARALLPEKLPLPKESVAWARLRDEAGNLLVSVQEVPRGLRITSKPGQVVALAFPALQMGKAEVPTVSATMDLLLDRVTGLPLDGFVRATVPEGQQSAFDLLADGLPFAVQTVRYQKENDGTWTFDLGGRLRLFGGEQGKPGSVALKLNGDGRLRGSVLVNREDIPAFALSSGDKLRYRADGIEGTFDADLANGRLDFDVRVAGAVELQLGADRNWGFTAALRASEKGVRVTDVTPGSYGDSTGFFDLGPAQVRLANPRVPKLAFSWNGGKAAEFEMLFDAQVRIPEVEGLTIEELKDVTLTEHGFVFPAVTVPELKPLHVNWHGFQVRPLAVRMPKTEINWFDGAPVGDWGFGVDLEVAFDYSPKAAPWIKDLKLTALNAGVKNGTITGKLETRELKETLVAGAKSSLKVYVDKIFGELKSMVGSTEDDDAFRGVGAEGSSRGNGLGASGRARRIKIPNIDVNLQGKFAFGNKALCGKEASQAPLAAYKLKLTAKGGLIGTIDHVVPECDVKFGQVTVTPGESKLNVGLPVPNVGPIGGGETDVWLETSATVKFPGIAKGSTVSATAALKLDLDQPKLLDGSVELAAPFAFGIPAAKPVFTFTAQTARFDTTGFTVRGAGALDLGDGATVTAQFDTLRLDLKTWDVRGGSATIASGFALGLQKSDSGGIDFKAMAFDAPYPNVPHARIGMNDTLRVTKYGISVKGSATARVAYDTSVYAAIRADFKDDFTVRFSTPGIDHGTIEFVKDSILVAHADSTGFWPDNILGFVNIPARLGLSDTASAYLELRDAEGHALVETSSAASRVRIRTPEGSAGVRLVVPALRADGAEAPTARVQLDVVVNTSTWQVMDGSIVAASEGDGPALFDLARWGAPLKVKRLAYEPKDGGGYQLKLDGRLTFPGKMDSVKVDLDGIVVAKDGLHGTATMGEYVETYTPGAAVAARANMSETASDTLVLELTGARAQFDGKNSSVKLSGQVRSSVFKTDTAYTPVFFTATAGREGVRFLVDPQLGAARAWTLGFATFEPHPIGEKPAVELKADNTGLVMRVGGTVRIPRISDKFAVTLDGLTIGTSGVVWPAMSITQEGQSQELEMFGLKFQLADTTDDKGVQYPALQAGRIDGQVKLTMSGRVTAFDNTARFYGLTVTGKGDVDVASVNLLSKPLVVLPNRFSVDTLRFQDHVMKVAASVRLPAPLDSASAQTVNFTVDKDGHVNGGGYVRVVHEAEGLATAHAKVPLGVATLHLRHLGVALDFEHFEDNSYVEAVVDAYVQNKEKNLIRVGSVDGEQVNAGLRLGFDGDFTWGNVQLADEFTIGYDVMSLTLTEVTIPAQHETFRIGFSGKLALAVQAVTGSVDFQGMAIDGSGINSNLATVRGGEFAVAGMVKLQLSNFQHAKSPTTIEVSSGTMPTGSGGAASTKTEKIDVQSFVRFGGTINVADVLGGGVGEVLFYRTADGETQFVVRDANLSVQSVLELRGDVRYRRGPTGYGVIIGAKGKLAKVYEVMLVGAAERDGTKNRLGLFVAASGLNIPITPATPVAFINGLGGGFFINPRTEYLDIVKRYAQVGDRTSGLIRVDDAAFAALLYGEMTVGPPQAAAARGRILATVTPFGFQLNGKMTLLEQGKKLEGIASLAMGFRRLQVEGNLDVVVDYGKPLQGTGTAGFFIYSNAWGITGNAEMSVMNGVLRSHSELFVGPPGFHTLVSVESGLPSFWIISLERAEAEAWYQARSGYWGMRGLVAIKAAPLGPLLSATATLEAALVSPPVKLYGAADLEISTLVKSWKGSVWASIGEQGGLDGGFGRDPEMDRAIARAREIADEMQHARDDAVQAVGDAQRAVASAPVPLTTQELVEAYNRIQGWSQEKFAAAASLAVDSAETAFGASPTARGYMDWYVTMLRQTGMPTDTASILRYRDEVASLLAQLQARGGNVRARLAAIEAKAERVARAGDTPSLPNPVLASSFDSVTVRTEIAANGDTVAVQTGGPRFDVDADVARRNAALLLEYQRQVAVADMAAQAKLASMEKDLATVRAATAANDDRSFLAYARLHGDAVTATERQYAAQVDFIFRRQEWLRGNMAQVQVRRAAGDSVIDKVAGLMLKRVVQCGLLTSTGHATGPNGEEWNVGTSIWLRMIPAALHQRACETVYGQAIKYVADRRMRAYAAWMERPELYADFANYATVNDPPATWYRDQSRIAGTQMWRDLAVAGMSAADLAADTAFTNAVAHEQSALGPLRAAHRDLSTRLTAINLLQAEGMGTLYDMYDRYVTTHPGAGDTLVARYEARKRELASLLEVPRVSDVTVTATTTGSVTRVDIAAAGSHAGGVYEWLFNDVEGAARPLAPVDSFTSWGTASTVTRYFHPRENGRRAPGAAPAGRSPLPPRTIQVAARGGAGYAGLMRAGYTPPSPWVTYAAGAPTAVITERLPDATAPGTPLLELPGKTTTTGLDGFASVWVKDRTRITARWSASDAESGIARYELAVYRRGANGMELLRDWQSMGGRDAADVALPTAATGDRLLLAVRAVNGAGLVSPEAFGPEIRVDVTAPAFPATALATPGRGIASVQGGAPVFPFVGGTSFAYTAESCPWSGTSWTDPVGGGAPGRLELAFDPATDAGSGVQAYRWRVDTAAVAAPNGTAAWASVPATASRIAADVPGVRYDRTYWATIVPVDFAGGEGKPLVYGPFQFVDRTPPATPDFCAWGDASDRQWVGVSMNAWDLETPVVGYQYRVVLQDGTVVRDWPANGALDWTRSPGNTPAQLAVPPMARGQWYWLDVRARNAHGLWTDIGRRQTWAAP